MVYTNAGPMYMHYNTVLRSLLRRPNDWYLVDTNYKLALEEVALLKEMAFAKFKW